MVVEESLSATIEGMISVNSFLGLKTMDTKKDLLLIELMLMETIVLKIAGG